MQQKAAGKGSGRVRAWVTLGLLVALPLHVCSLSIALGGDGDEFSHCHAEGAPNEARQPRQHQRSQPLTASPDTCGAAAGGHQAARAEAHQVRALPRRIAASGTCPRSQRSAVQRSFAIGIVRSTYGRDCCWSLAPSMRLATETKPAPHCTVAGSACVLLAISLAHFCLSLSASPVQATLAPASVYPLQLGGCIGTT